MELKQCLQALQEWYNENKRDLPWRQTTNPYPIWISEIMLQQTRVEAVKAYFNRFMMKVKDVNALACIEENQLLKLWEGLGYYSRAKNLKVAALTIVNDYHGQFPSTYQELLQLKGIGEYTAAAIASISFQEKVPAIDGNVLRVMMRVLNSYDDITHSKTKRNVFQILKPFMPDHPGDLNQAFMDLGATICIPKNPKCDVCPIQKYCQGYQQNTMLELPVKGKKLLKKIEEYTILIYLYQNKIALVKRSDKGVLQGLFAFPSQEGFYTKEQIEKLCRKDHIKIKQIQRGPNSKHVFTHKIWYMECYCIILMEPISNVIWSTKQELQEKFAIPSAYQAYKEYIKKELNSEFEYDMIEKNRRVL